MKIKILIPVFLLLLVFTTEKIFSQAEAGDAQEICINQTYLNAETPATGFTGEWSINSGACDFANKFSNTTFVTNLLPQINILRWSISNGNTVDDSYDDVSITNNKTNTASTFIDKEICENFYTINASLAGSGETGHWTVVSGGGNILTPSTNTSDVTDILLGINKFEWKISKGICSSKDTIIITNHEITANAGSNQTTCNDYADLTADDPSPGTGTWSVISPITGQVFGNIYDFHTTITDLDINTNSLQWDVEYGGCSNYANVIITSNKPTTADAGSNKVSCSNHIFLSGNNPVNGIGEWTIVSGAGIFANSNEYNTEVTNINTDINEYKWTITKNGCSSEDNVEINYVFFTADAGDDGETCTDSYILEGNDPSPGTGKWRVTGGSGSLSDDSQYNTEVTGLISVENTLEWEITRGECTQTDYVIISRNTESDANAGANIETCNGNTTLSATNPPVGSGVWTVFSGTGTFANSLQNNTTVTNIGLNNNTYRWTVNYIGCSNYDDVIVTNNYVTTNAGPDQIVCGTTSSLIANQPQSGETGTWQVMAGTSTVSDINQYNSDVINLASDINKFRWTILKGICTVFDEIEITNNQHFASANVSGPSDICEDFTSIIGNTPPIGGTGVWMIQSGSGIFDDSNDQSTVVSNLSIGANKIRWIIEKDNCSNYDEIIINRNTVFADAGTNQETCFDYTTLSAVPTNVGITGIWSISGGSGILAEPTNYNTDVTNLSLGLNTFTWTVTGNGCTDDDNVIITNNMFLTGAGSNQNICEDNTNLNATDTPIPDYGFWEVVSGTGTFSNISNHTTNVSGILENSSNIYRWNAFLNGCSASDEVSVTNNLITADAGSDIFVCSNVATLSAVTPASGTGTWTKQSGAGIFTDGNSPSTEVTNINLDENIYRWSVTNITCNTYDDVSVTNNSISAFAGTNKELCDNFTQLSGNQPPEGGSGIWEIISGNADIQDISLHNTNITNLESGLNTFTWTLYNNSCTSNEDEVTINNKSFTIFAGNDQELTPFITSTFLEAELPLNATGEWILTGGAGDIENISDPGSEVTNMATGKNEFLWHVQKDGCSAEDNVNITVINFEVNPGTDKTICENSVQLSAANYNGAVQEWSLIEGAGEFDDINAYNTWVRNVGIGINIFRWTVNQDGAIAYNDLIITQIYANAGEDQIVCTNDIIMNGNIPDENCTGLWSIVGGSGNIISPTLYNTEIQNINFLNNTFLWTVSSECTTFDYININNDQVIANAGTDQVINDNETYLNAETPSNSDESLWSVVDGSGNFTDETNPDTFVQGISLGENIYRWSVSNENCSDYDDVTVTNNFGISIDEIGKKLIVYPNPNNGIFNIELNNLKYEIEIINIYGKLVYKTNNNQNENTIINISDQSAGIYFIKISNNNKESIIKIVIK